MPAANFSSHELIARQREITHARNRLRRYGYKVQDNVAEFPCAGGCGKVVRVKLKNLRPCNILVCNDRDSRDACRQNVPLAVGGLTATFKAQAAGHFMGVTYEDKGPLSALGAATKDVIRSIAFPIKVGLGIAKGR